MGTDIRPEVSKSSKYWIEKHRYYELKHYCLQYNSWKQAIAFMNYYPDRAIEDVKQINPEISDPTVKLAEIRMIYSSKMEIIEEAAKMTDPVIGNYILEGVTNGLSFDKLNARNPVPCCKDTYYELYRKFFWHLDQLRQ